MDYSRITAARKKSLKRILRNECINRKHANGNLATSAAPTVPLLRQVSKMGSTRAKKHTETKQSCKRNRRSEYDARIETSREREAFARISAIKLSCLL